MKKLILLLILLPAVAGAQFEAPAASPPASVATTAGYTKLTIDYHRPNVRARKIFGDLIPWGEVWRAGANENTLLTIDGDATIGQTAVPSGTYSIFLVPDQDGWTWVINNDIKHWGARGYNQTRDLVRQPARVKRMPERVESLEYRWMNVTPQSVDLVLEWEWYRVSLSIKLPTDEQVADRAALELNPAKDPKDYYAIARYYLDNGSPRKAKAYIDRWAAGDDEKDSYGRIRYQAVIEHELGNEVKAQRLMKRSLELARSADNKHYVRMNEKSLREWSRDLTEINPDSLLRRSIRYHDPKGAWTTKTHLLQLSESRPSGTVRHTRLTLYPDGEQFDLHQVRGKDKVQMRYLNDNFSFSHQGRTDIDDNTADRLNLNRKSTLMMRDYYSYLYGLPMKLRDPGAQIRPEVYKVWYDGRELLEMEVSYAPDTGEDVWRFYFNPETFVLSGYAFFSENEGPAGGEFILLEGEAEVSGMKLPAKRHWYLKKDGLYLGTDELLN